MHYTHPNYDDKPRADEEKKEMAHRAKAFGMTIQYHNRSRLSPELEDGAKYVTFEELLSTSDVFSLNLALNASTRHIIGAKELAQMKDGVVIVNTARGALIDEKALVAAIESGKVRFFFFVSYFLPWPNKTDCGNRSDPPVSTSLKTSRRLKKGC